jgi:DNA-binding MarR family transcriptional regulator
VQVTTDTVVRDLSRFAKLLLHAGGRDFYRAVGELDLSISQIRTLHLLTAEVEEATLKGLADEIGLSLPATSRSVDSLLQRGLVTRVESADDRRAKTVRATPGAHALVDRLTQLRIAGIADLVAVLDEAERAALVESLEPILSRHA